MRLGHDGRIITGCGSIYDVQVVTGLIEWTDGQPARMLRVILALEEATEWARKRRLAREKQAQEILRKQRSAIEEIQARLAIRSLADEGG